MTSKPIEYIDSSAPEYDQKKTTAPMLSIGEAARKFHMPELQETEARVCPYNACENVTVFEQGRRVLKPLGWLAYEEATGARRCRCLLDRIERAKPMEVSSSSKRAFDREPIEDDPERESE